MFVTGSYDASVRVWDTNTMTDVYSFDLESRVNSAVMSPIADHCLIATAAAEPQIRLCDLRSGALTHSLTGHHGAVLSCAWSPRQEHILFSGGNDGTLRVWDIRRAAACLMSLDQDNAVDRDPLAETNLAHGKGVNGLTLSKDGTFLVSLGLDEKIRCWDTYSGHNTLVNYGSYFRNRFQSCLEAVVSDADVWPPLIYVPSDDHQVLVFGLLDGRLMARLRGAYGRVTSIEKRPAYQELYSGSNDCEILVWEPSSVNASTTEAISENMLDAWSESEEESS
ncbi:excision repair cross-complementing rodent repair deficiency, complementation group 8, isoform CRA_f [Radiomyces spectabilis]|uniref:excision repair cross-complementing rodent repair deficiency, complementation group 8, isoform CRA_f n=1 Tax=Radiomyces spectabilis TaxID=64574 RepID=UPI00221F46F0|nr:excision repair cross-complementing rodent repair deficiency, complementation group 8, isoform CRA_f [Radiomyces spectabilis]KAI8393546.1 excision repair cross-complementing rodent repair deficiency, complementation group 8, isoform CRA_f [Radiomyces spectabilis]